MRDFYVPDLVRDDTACLYPQAPAINAFGIDFGGRNVRPAVLREQLMSAAPPSAAKVALSFRSPCADFVTPASVHFTRNQFPKLSFTNGLPRWLSTR